MRHVYQKIQVRRSPTMRWFVLDGNSEANNKVIEPHAKAVAYAFQLAIIYQRTSFDWCCATPCRRKRK